MEIVHVSVCVYIYIYIYIYLYGGIDLHILCRRLELLHLEGKARKEEDEGDTQGVDSDLGPEGPTEAADLCVCVWVCVCVCLSVCACVCT
jgi:hypothetical protein